MSAANIDVGQLAAGAHQVRTFVMFDQVEILAVSHRLYSRPSMNVSRNYVISRIVAFFGENNNGHFMRRQKRSNFTPWIHQTIDIDTERVGGPLRQVYKNVDLAVGKTVGNEIVEIPYRAKNRVGSKWPLKLFMAMRRPPGRSMRA